MDTLDFTNITSQSDSPPRSQRNGNNSNYNDDDDDDNKNNKEDGDRTINRGPCQCGFKHWCDGKEYDFVFKWPTTQGDQFVGVNASDNLYDVAERFILRYEYSNPKKQYLVTSMVRRITNHIMEFAPQVALGRKVEPPSPAEDFGMDGPLTILTPADLAEIEERKRKAQLIKAQVDEEEAKRKKEQQRIKEQFEKDRREFEARPNIPSTASTVPSGYAPVVGNDGNVKIVPKPTKTKGIGSLKDLKSTTTTPKPFTSATSSENVPTVLNRDDDDDDEDDSDDESEGYYPTKEGWTAQIVLSCITHKGKERTVDIMRQCGFSDPEIDRYMKSVINEVNMMHRNHHHNDSEKTPPKKVFGGQGHRLVSTTTTTTSSTTSTTTSSQPPPEDYKIVVNPTLPQTRIKVRLINGTQLTVEANHSTTVHQLIRHVASLCPDDKFVLKDFGTRPPQVLSPEKNSLSIKDANLINGNVVQVKL